MSGKLPQLMSREVIRALRKDGWIERAQKGSHLQMVHPEKSGRVTIPVHQGRDLPYPTVRTILKQASLTEDELKELL